MIEDYFRQVAALIAGVSIVHSSSITYDKRSSYIGLIRGDIYFFDGFRGIDVMYNYFIQR